MPLDAAQVAEAKRWRAERKNSALAESLGRASQFDPTHERKSDALAVELDAPLDAVSNNFADAGRIAEARKRPDPAELRAEAPRTAEWLENPRNSRQSSDDIETMKAYERAQGKKDIPFWSNTGRGVGERLNSLSGNLMEFAGNVGGDFERKMRDFNIPNPGIVFGEDGISWSWDVDTSAVGSALNTIGRGVSEGGLGYKPNFTWDNLKGAPTVENIAGFIVETGAQSMADMAAIMATMPAYLMSRTEEIAESRVINKGGEAGRDVDVGELIEAMPTAVMVAVSERWATKGILGGFADDVAKVTVGHAAKETGKAFVREAGTEFVQEQIEYAGETLGTDVKFDIATSLDRGFAGAVAGGPIGAGIRAVTLPLDAVNIKVQDDVVRGLNSISEQQSIDGMVDSIQNMKLFQESPERAAEYLRDMEGDDKLYLTPEEVLAASEEGLPVPQYLVEAAQSSTDVELTLDKFALDVMGNEELLNRLRPHLKRSPEALTQSELENRDTTALDKLIKRVTEDKDVRSEAEAIHDEVTSQLVATGRLSEETARQSATIIPAYVTTKVAELKARDIDITVQEVYDKMNFTIEPGKRTTKKPKKAEEPVVLPEDVAAAPVITPAMDTTAELSEGESLTVKSAAENPRIDMYYKEVTKRIPELTEAAKLVSAGKMTREAYGQLVNDYKPVSPYDAPPTPNTTEEVTNAVAKNKKDRVGAPSRDLSEGHQVGVRLDIPAYTRNGVWAVSVHEFGSGFKAGKSIGYESVAHVTDATLGAHEGVSLKIASGSPKSTIAVVKGRWKTTNIEDANALAAEAINNPEWIQVGYDPERHSYFYNRKTMEPVVAGDEVLQVGPLTLVRNPTYGDPSTFLFQEDMGELAEIQAEISTYEKLLACTQAA